MPSRRLTEAEVEEAEAILVRVKADITKASGGDPTLLQALRRRVFIRLMYWERSKPADRRKLRRAKHIEQQGLCVVCSHFISLDDSILERSDPAFGYTVENTRLVHVECRLKDQQ